MTLILHLDPDTEKRLAEAAAARGLTLEALALEAVQAWTEAEEFAAFESDTAADEAAIAEFERTGVAIAGEEVLAWLKSLATDNPLPKPEARKLR
jgi:predicted transcriptional regulator